MFIEDHEGLSTAEQNEALQIEVDDLRRKLSRLDRKLDAMCDIHYARGAQHGFDLGQLDDNEGLADAMERMGPALAELKSLRNTETPEDAMAREDALDSAIRERGYF